MKTEVQIFLGENRDTVIKYYNENVKNYWNISLKDFMLDVMNNWRKITIVVDMTRTDLMGNLSEAKSRLGLMDMEIGVAFDRDEARRRKAPNGQWMAII